MLYAHFQLSRLLINQNIFWHFKIFCASMWSERACSYDTRGKMLFSISLMASCRRMGGSEKGMWDGGLPIYTEKGFKGARLEFEINVSCCFLLPLFRYFSVYPETKHNNDDAYQNNKHRKTFFYNFNMFGAALRGKLLFDITIKSRLSVLPRQLCRRLKLRQAPINYS